MMLSMLKAIIACFGRETGAGFVACAWQHLLAVCEMSCDYIAARLAKWSGVRLLGKMFIAFLLCIPMAHAVPPGTNISNTVTVLADTGSGPTPVVSNTVNLVTVSVSSISLLQYDSTGTGTVVLPVPSQHSTTPTPPGTFVASANPTYPQAGAAPLVIDQNIAQHFDPVTQYRLDEPVIVQVDDADQNANLAVQDTIIVVVTSTSGDTEEILLTETGVNTGVFIGFVQSSDVPVSTYDGVISISNGESVTVTYTDQFDNTDISAGTVLVDPYGIVFNSSTGAPIDGVTVEILDQFGAPAAVFGDDGISTYPNVLTTGGSAMDSGGTNYNFPAGGYRFPLLAPGDYQMVVTSTDPNLLLPSTASIASLQVLPGAPYALDANASFGGIFTLQAGPPLHVDIPADQLNSTLVVTKGASATSAAIGDFVKYRLTVENRDPGATAISVDVNDRLPKGFRYQSGSVRFNTIYNVSFEPTVSSDGRSLTFSIGDLPPASPAFDIEYVTEITAGTNTGRAINSVTATDASMTVSNTAQAEIQIKDDLFSDKAFIVGRIHHGECDADTAELSGLQNIKLYLEDGTSVVTDAEGNYHFEAVEPGTHIVQVDTHSIPSTMEIVQCEENTRFAGTPYSQFVDVRGGSLWRADFTVRNKPPVKDVTEVDVKSELIGRDVKYTIAIENGTVPVMNFRLMVSLPDGIEYVLDSSWMDGERIDDPQVMDNLLIYRLGDLDRGWDRDLELRARLKVSSSSELTTKTVVLLDTFEKRNVRSQPIESKLEVVSGQVENSKINFQALFKPLSAELTEISQRGLDQLIDNLGDVDIRVEKVVGYSDSIPIRSSRAKYKSNKELSAARARSVADYMVARLGIKDEVEVIGMGAANPVATNKTAEGRARNRRVEIHVATSKVINKGSVNIVDETDTASKIVVEGLPQDDLRFVLPDAPKRSDLSIEKFDDFWMKSAQPGVEWLMPVDGHYTNRKAVDVAIKHAPDTKFELTLNGEELNPLFYFGVMKNRQGTIARSYWQGVHLRRGENVFIFNVLGGDGEVTQRIEKRVIYAGDPYRVEVAEEYSRLIADGTHTPVIALRFFDEDGHFARPGSGGYYQVNAPYVAKEIDEAVTHNRLGGMNRDGTKYSVGEAGIALIELEETAQTGKVEISLPMRDGKKREVEAWLQPDLRDWIMVGLAEATVGYSHIKDNLVNAEQDGVEDEFFVEGRTAFFAKGRVKGEWLLTVAYDSDRDTEATTNRVHQMIDPDTYYTIYGDASDQDHEASSSEKLYLKLERDRFYAVFGDIRTEMTDTELMKYDRNITGLKSEYDDGEISVEVFAAESNNTFFRDEIAGDGTSGLYQLSNTDLLLNSENITIETRDRFRNEIIIASTTLQRHIDYSIDYDSGELFFREPITSHDGSFNPNIIVVNYEVASAVKGDLSFGGRAAIKLDDDSVELGISAIHDGTFANETDLIGVDATVDIDEDTRARFEFATSDGEVNGVSADGNAFLAELTHDTPDMKARVYTQQQDAGFGVNQQSASQSGTTKYGADGEYRIDENLRVDAEIYREQNDLQDIERDVLAANVTYEERKYSLSAGARIARDTDGLGNDMQSDLLLLGATRKLNDGQIQLRANAEVAIGDDANEDYPSRYIIGADYFVTSAINLFAENEWTFGDVLDTQMSRAGVRAIPWAGATLNSTVNREVQESGYRSFATLGLTQAFKLSERITSDVSFDRSETLNGTVGPTLNNNVTPVQGTYNDDFTAVSVGATYEGDTFTLANRLEQRNSDQEHKTGAIMKWERDTIEGIAYSISLELFDIERADGTTARDTDVRFSLGYRPLGSKWIILNKLELIINENETAAFGMDEQRKLIDNFVANYLPDDDNQWSFNYGVKHVTNSFDGVEYDGFTHLLGTEYRHDLSETTDFGVHGFAHHSANAGATQYAFGASFGWNMARNIWLSVGYNLEGFQDADFSSAGYTAQGPYMKFRLKFDQDTARDLQDWLN